MAAHMYTEEGLTYHEYFLEALGKMYNKEEGMRCQHFVVDVGCQLQPWWDRYGGTGMVCMLCLPSVAYCDVYIDLFQAPPWGTSAYAHICRAMAYPRSCGIMSEEVQLQITTRNRAYIRR